MGDAKKDDLRVGFDSRVKLRFCGSKVTSDAGLLAYRELDETLGLTEMGSDVLTDSRPGSNKRHLLVPLLRQPIYSRLAGYEDVNYAERVGVQSRHASRRGPCHGGCSPGSSTGSRGWRFHRRASASVQIEQAARRKTCPTRENYAPIAVFRPLRAV
jgi:hypothetical protein